MLYRSGNEWFIRFGNIDEFYIDNVEWEKSDIVEIMLCNYIYRKKKSKIC